MKNLKFGTNFAVFVIFFGAALFDAFSTQNWMRVGIFAALGIVSLWADTKNT